MWFLCDAAHPRSRGEHLANLDEHGDDRGSSPLARGTPSAPGRIFPAVRLIPARAGNTETCPGRHESTTAHPRSRGEHLQHRARIVIQPGSSPLARGTRCEHHHRHFERRLIPARAGNTPPFMWTAPHAAAHPRSRGEHYAKNPISSMHRGSSPLARGTRLRSGPGAHLLRLIPARAGNTPTRAT